jgi:hypothetical protein
MNTHTGGKTSLHFQVLLLCDPEEGVVITTNVSLVCMSAIQIVSGQKVSFWHICIRAVQTNTIPKHGLTSKKLNNAKVKPETLDLLCVFFAKMEAFCDVIPTWFVRDRTGTTTTRNNKEKALTLPPCWSKSGMYG